MFDLKAIACSFKVRAAGSLTVHTDMLISEAIDCISDFHVLIVPGGPPSIIDPLIKAKGLELNLIRKFAALPSEVASGTRILLSVCTGAFFLGAAGVLAGTNATTHHIGQDHLRDICSRSNAPDSPPTNVVHKRYVDGGHLRNGGVRVITAGGVSSGLDATCYIVSQLTAKDTADFVARLMEYEWCELKEWLVIQRSKNWGQLAKMGTIAMILMGR